MVDGAAHDIRPVRSIGIQLAIPPDGRSQLARIVFVAVIAVLDTGQIDQIGTLPFITPLGLVSPGVKPLGVATPGVGTPKSWTFWMV